MDKLRPVVNITLDENVELHTHSEVINNWQDIQILSGGTASEVRYISGVVDDNTADIAQIIDGDIVMTGNKNIYGNVTVYGSFYALSAVIITTEEFALSSNFIDLNNNWTSGIPLEDAGIRVIRGDEPSSELRWNESGDYWEAGEAGSLERLVTSGDIDEISHSNLNDLEWSNAGHTIDEDVYFGSNDLSGVGGVFFDITDIHEHEGEGLVHWNPDEQTLDVHTGLGPILQVGQEIHTLVYNNTQSIIPNGTVIYPTGIINNKPAVSPATAETHEGFTLGVAVATMDIPLSGDGIGIVARAGAVRDLDTTSLTPGAPVYLSPLSGGVLTSTRPEFPNYVVQIGGCFESHPTSGAIELEIDADQEDTFANAFNGSFRESIDFLVDSDGTNVSGFLTPSNGNVDMTMCFSDGFSLLDTSPFAYVALTPGTDTNPQRNYVYITKDNKYLEVSTSSWPDSSTEHIKVADIILMSAATTQTDDALKNQNWNDHVRGVDGNGHIVHIAEALRRKVGATWLNGTAGSATVSGTPSDVLISVTGGNIMQMHQQTFPALSNPSDDLHIVNNFTTPYARVSNLNTQTSDALGNTLANSSFSVVLWGIANKTGETSHMMINLPTDSYAKNDPDSAVSDALNYSVYSIPNEFQSVGFLIARFTFILEANGTTWTLYDTEDLRGKIPNSTAGGGAGGTGVTDFTGLTDTPTSYSGAGGYLVQVNDAENATEFTTDPTVNTLGVGTATQLSGALLTVDGSGYFENNLIVQGQSWSETSTLTDAASIATDCDDGNVHTVTLTANRALANPTNLKDGATYIWIIKQDGTGSRTLTYGSAFKFPGGSIPTLTTGTPNAVDILTGVSDGTNVYCSMQFDFS